jgi:hypothetical protein
VLNRLTGALTTTLRIGSRTRALGIMGVFFNTPIKIRFFLKFLYRD